MSECVVTLTLNDEWDCSLVEPPGRESSALLVYYLNNRCEH